jgi:hypothetical protein
MPLTQEEFVASVRKFVVEKGWVQDPEKPRLYWKEIKDHWTFGEWRSQVDFPEYARFGEARFHDIPGQEISFAFPIRDGTWFPGMSYTWKFNFEHQRFELFKYSGSRQGGWMDKEFKTHEEFYTHLTQTILKGKE